MSKILVVEDDAILLRALQTKLTGEGYDVVTAQDGEAAVEKIAEKPDGVILDVMLPKKNGLEVLEEIHKDPSLSAIPIIVISNSGRPVEIERARSLGARDFLIKVDFTPEEVATKLKAHVPPTAAPKPRTALPYAAPDKKRTIFVVEDDAFLKKLLVDKLAKTGFEVWEAAGGKEALKVLETKSPSLVLLDLVMPDVDGFQVLERVRHEARFQAIPIMILSNLGEREHLERAKALGASDYLVKAHFTLDEIIERITKMMP